MATTASRISPLGALTPAFQRLRRWRLVANTRGRILGAYIVLLVLALAFGYFIQRSILLAQVEDEIDRQLVQEVEELQQFSTSVDPATGEPFGEDVEALFTTFLSRNIPVAGEALFTIVEGEPFRSTISPVQLLSDPTALAEWSPVTQSTRGELQTAEGPVRYVATPVVINGEVAGVFVMAIFLQERLDDVNRVLRVGMLVFGGTLLAATALAWLAAGRVLRPIGQLTDTARAISDSNWRERIPVRGDDELAELAHTFNQMLDRLEDSFAMQRRFIDDAGHELRTPITIIRGHLELLGDDPAEREETMRLVSDELDRMSRMVEDLLLLARYETPEFLSPEPIDVAAFTAELAGKAVAFGDRGWEVSHTAGIVAIGDRQRLTQAVMNLVRNAVEHTPKGTPVSIGSRAADGEVRIWVEDGGPGIPEADRERIFDRFARGAAGRRQTGGAGLGLAIVRAVAEAHGGRVELRTAPGRGSRFTMILPVEGPGGAAQ